MGASAGFEVGFDTSDRTVIKEGFGNAVMSWEALHGISALSVAAAEDYS